MNIIHFDKLLYLCVFVFLFRIWSIGKYLNQSYPPKKKNKGAGKMLDWRVITVSIQWKSYLIDCSLSNLITNQFEYFFEVSNSRRLLKMWILCFEVYGQYLQQLGWYYQACSRGNKLMFYLFFNYLSNFCTYNFICKLCN